MRKYSRGKALALLAMGCASLAVLAPYLTHEYSQSAFLFLFVVFVLFFIICIVLLFLQPSKGLNFSITFFAMALSLLSLEGLMRWNLDRLPESVQRRFFDGDILKIQLEKLDLFDHPPFVKFKPNVCIHENVPTDGDVVNAWCTDARGFKNLPSVLKQPTITLVIAGDSFTEGMGIPTEQTWGSLLNQRGMPTYSLGVQGYAPTMSLGAVKKFGMDLKPAVVVLGCSNCVLGDRSYYDPETGYQYGAMVNFINAELRAQDRVRYRLSTSAVLHAGLDQLASLYPETGNRLHFPIDWNATSFRQWVVRKIRNDPRQAPVSKRRLAAAIDIPSDVPKLIRRYENEIRFYAANKSSRTALLADPAWKSVSRTLLNFKEMVEKAGGRPALIHFPHRGVLYFRAFVGAFPKDSFFSLDPILLREFAADNGIDFIDLTGPLLAYIRKIGPDAPLTKYPYFIQDPHLNQVGQIIVADVVEKYVRAHLGR